MAAIEDTTAQHDQLLQSLQQTIHALTAKWDDAENQQCRNNFQVLGLPEGSEVEHAAEFAESFFKYLLDLYDLSPTYMIEWTHRVPTGHRVPGTPQTFLSPVLQFQGQGQDPE